MVCGALLLSPASSLLRDEGVVFFGLAMYGMLDDLSPSLFSFTHSCTFLSFSPSLCLSLLPPQNAAWRIMSRDIAAAAATTCCCCRCCDSVHFAQRNLADFTLCLLENNLGTRGGFYAAAAAAAAVPPDVVEACRGMKRWGRLLEQRVDGRRDDHIHTT